MTAAGTTQPRLLDWLFAPQGMARGFGQYAPAVMLSNAIGFARTLALAWLFAEALGEYGLLHLCLQLVNLFMGLASLGFPDSIARFVSTAAAAGQLRSFLRRKLPWAIGLALVMCGLGYTLAPWYAGFLYETVGPAHAAHAGAPNLIDNLTTIALTRFTLVCTLAFIAYYLAVSVVRGLAMTRALVSLELLHAVTFTLFALGGVWALGPTARVVLAAYFFALLLPAGVVGWLLAVYLHPRPETPAGTEQRGSPTAFWRFTLGLALAAVSWQVMVGFSDWYVLHAIGQAPLGQISGFRLIAQIVLILIAAVGTVLQGTIFQSWESGQRQAARRQWTFIFKLTILASSLLCAVLVMGGPLAARMLPGSFHEALPVWGPALFGYLLRGALFLLSLRFTLRQRSLLVFIPQAIGAGVVVWACPPLTQAWGLYGAMLAGSLACAAAAVVEVILLWIVREPFDFSSLLALVTSLVCLLPPFWAGLSMVLILLFVWKTRIYFNALEHEALLRVFRYRTKPA